MPPERWYCWIAAAGMEFAVWAELNDQGFTAVLPLKVSRERRPHSIVPAFPSYGLIALAPHHGRINQFARLPEQGAYSPSWTFLRRYVETEAWGRVAEPRPFRTGAVEEMFERGRQGDGVFDDEAVLEALRLHAGDPVRVIEGPLAGYVGACLAPADENAERVVVEISGRRVALPRDAVEKAENAAAGGA